MIRAELKNGKIKTSIATRSGKLPREVYDLTVTLISRIQKETSNAVFAATAFAAYCAVREFIPDNEINEWEARAIELSQKLFEEVGE